MRSMVRPHHLALNHPGNEDGGHDRFVLLPVRPVLLRAEVVIPARPVHQQDEEVDGVEVPGVITQ